MYVIECRCIVKGFAEGEPLISDTPINFLSMIDAENGLIKDPDHSLYGKTLKDKIFVFPNSVGSSVGAYMLYSLKKKGSGPLAIVCSNRIDITTASGCAISNIPAVYLKHNTLLQVLRNARTMTVDCEGEQILIYQS